MANTLPVTIGGLQLFGLEVPTYFDRGGRVRVAVHHVIGGDRVVQVLGTDPQRRELTGCFIGPQAAERGQLLEAMRDAASPLMLTIGAWTEYVLIVSVVVRYAEKGSVVRYLIEAEALPPSGTVITTTEAALVSGLLADVSQSSAILGGVSASSVSVSSVQTALSSATTSVSSSYQSGNLISADLTTPGLSVMNMISASGNDISSVNENAETSGLVADASDLTRATNDAQALASATQAGGYLNRAGALLSALDGTAFLPVIYS